MKSILIAVTTLFTVGFATAQTADEVINKHIEALGGKAKLEGIKNVVMEGNVTVQGTKVDVMITAVQNKLMRQDISVAGMKGYDFTTDTAGWTFMPFQGMQKPEPKTPEDVKEALSDLDLTGSLYNYAAKGNKVELLGKEDVEGTECHKLKVTLASGKEETYFIDPTSYLIVRSKSKRKVNGQEIEATVDLSDYKEVEGVKMAHSINQGLGTIVLTSIKANQTIDPKMYKHD